MKQLPAVVLGFALAACAEPHAVPATGPSADFAFVNASTPAAAAVDGSLADARAEREACREPSAGALAFVRCDGDRIELARDVSFHPGRSIPPEPARAVLDRVAQLMRERDDILLVRVEVYGSRRSAGSAERRRREIAETQARADAILHYLWRRRGISAERLEAVGYGADARFEGRSERWPVVLRILQRTRVP